MGDPVWCNSLGHAGRQGAATDLAVVARDRLYRLPDGVDPAVAVAHPAVTAYLGWFRRAAIRPGWTVFVGGGAGNVGIAAIQLAVRAGVRVITSARDSTAERCWAAGAAAVVDYR
ncbi:MAG TPA: NADPH:quinone reductase, partial [Nakamurella sp.]